MIASEITVFDGHTYEVGEEVPELGSFRCDTIENGKRNYLGLSGDVDKLPTRSVYPQYKDLKTGSTAFCIDDGTLYMYEYTTDRWHEE